MFGNMPAGLPRKFRIMSGRVERQSATACRPIQSLLFGGFERKAVSLALTKRETSSKVNRSGSGCLTLLSVVTGRNPKPSHMPVRIGRLLRPQDLLGLTAQPLRRYFPAHDGRLICNSCWDKAFYDLFLHAFNFRTSYRQPFFLAAFSNSICALSMSMLDPRVRTHHGRTDIETSGRGVEGA